MLDKPGYTFRNSEVPVLARTQHAHSRAQMFVDLVRESLVNSLLQNSVSTVETVFSLSSSIFVSLVAYFKPHLKTELGRLQAALGFVVAPVD